MYTSFEAARGTGLVQDSLLTDFKAVQSLIAAMSSIPSHATARPIANAFNPFAFPFGSGQINPASYETVKQRSFISCSSYRAAPEDGHGLYNQDFLYGLSKKSGY